VKEKIRRNRIKELAVGIVSNGERKHPDFFCSRWPKKGEGLAYAEAAWRKSLSEG